MADSGLCTLLALPREIRHVIYFYVFVNLRSSCTFQPMHRATPPMLADVCKQIRQESPRAFVEFELSIMVYLDQQRILRQNPRKGMIKWLYEGGVMNTPLRHKVKVSVLGNNVDYRRPIMFTIDPPQSSQHRIVYSHHLGQCLKCEASLSQSVQDSISLLFYHGLEPMTEHQALQEAKNRHSESIELMSRLFQPITDRNMITIASLIDTASSLSVSATLELGSSIEHLQEAAEICRFYKSFVHSFCEATGVPMDDLRFNMRSSTGMDFVLESIYRASGLELTYNHAHGMKMVFGPRFADLFLGGELFMEDALRLCLENKPNQEVDWPTMCSTDY